MASTLQKCVDLRSVRVCGEKQDCETYRVASEEMGEKESDWAGDADGATFRTFNPFGNGSRWKIARKREGNE
jgi:hypothetical protein